MHCNTRLDDPERTIIKKMSSLSPWRTYTFATNNVKTSTEVSRALQRLGDTRWTTRHLSCCHLTNRHLQCSVSFRYCWWQSWGGICEATPPQFIIWLTFHWASWNIHMLQSPSLHLARALVLTEALRDTCQNYKEESFGEPGGWVLDAAWKCRRKKKRIRKSSSRFKRSLVTSTAWSCWVWFHLGRTSFLPILDSMILGVRETLLQHKRCSSTDHKCFRGEQRKRKRGVHNHISKRSCVNICICKPGYMTNSSCLWKTPVWPQ